MTTQTTKYEWQPIETAPKDGREILVRFPRMMDVIILASWNKIHCYWQSKGKPEFFHEGDMWCNIPAWKHWSDCSVHNAPALPVGECDCGGFYV